MNFKHLLILAFPILALTTVSCDQCIGPLGKEKVVCNNGGTCNDGECDCLKGYSGNYCDSLDLCELKDVECLYGDCTDGKCFCQPGYEGEFCDEESRAKFIGRYRITEGCVKLDTIENLEIWIERDLLNGDIIRIYNLFNANQFPVVGFFSPIEGTAEAGKATFKIKNQRPDDNSKEVNGEGVINYTDPENIVLTINYTVTSGTKEYPCRAEGYQFE